MLFGWTEVLRSQPEWQGAGRTAGGGGCCFLGAGGCLTGLGATGSIIGCESGDEVCDGGGESLTRGTGASMAGSTGMLVGTHVDHLKDLSHVGNCTSKNSACAVVKRTLLGECMNKHHCQVPHPSIPKVPI